MKGVWFACLSLLFSFVLASAVQAQCGEVAHARSPGITPAVSQFIYDAGYKSISAKQAPISVQYWFQERIVVRLKDSIKAGKVVFTALNMDGFPMYVDTVTRPPFMTTWTQSHDGAFLITGVKADIYPVKGKVIKVAYYVDQAAAQDEAEEDWAKYGFYYSAGCR